MDDVVYISPTTGRPVKALLFDVFGTVVDWRTSMTRRIQRFADRYALNVNAEDLADQWRSLYQPAMERIRSGRREFVLLDQLHRENLSAVLADNGLDEDNFDAADLEYLNHGWHQLDPWPDAVAGLTLLRERFVVGPLSNANTSLLVNMARYGRLPWDVVLGSDVLGAYKPDPRAYLGAARFLGLEPGELMLCAAHNQDLAAAREAGLATAFVARPREHGPNQARDLVPEQDWDASVEAFPVLDRTLRA